MMISQSSDCGIVCIRKEKQNEHIQKEHAKNYDHIYTYGKEDLT